MARSIWSGAISFGLVNVPVKLYTATSPKSVRFHQLSGKTGARIRQQRVDSTTGDEVPYEDIVKGYEITPDRYVIIEPDELDALDPKATKTIDIEEFVDLAEIDPIYYDHNYYLAPTAGGAKAYRLLLDAMRESGKVGIGKVVIRSKQQLCALRPTGEVLTLTTMLFGDEVLPPDRLDELDTVTEAEATQRELNMAQQLIESLSAEFEPEKFKDEYRERVLELIERKAAGEEIAVQPAAEEPAAAPDLMAALEASLAAVRGEDEAPKDAPKRKRPREPAADGADAGADASADAKQRAADGAGGKRPARAKAKARS
ncbi:MAG: Ku protein [Solirubrobacterales bacterium]|nr:Ku protein [Solirubrobacterales bacterium]MBV9717119.1 Ku protein [Solirubrobacterales bacterium]